MIIPIRRKHDFVVTIKNQYLDHWSLVWIWHSKSGSDNISLLIAVNAKSFIRELNICLQLNSEESYAWEFRVVEINHSLLAFVNFRAWVATNAHVIVHVKHIIQRHKESAVVFIRVIKHCVKLGSPLAWFIWPRARPFSITPGIANLDQLDNFPLVLEFING